MTIDDAYRTAALGQAALDATTRANQAEKPGSGGKSVDRTGAPLAAGTDAVQVSDEARLRAEALKAAQEAPAIRPDVVARGKALLESGSLGSDPAALADRLIEAFLNEPSKG